MTSATEPITRTFFALCFLFTLNTSFAGGVYQEPDAFIAEAFDQAPEVKVIWPDSALKKQMADILQHDYKGLRIRYWIKDNRTAWILEEIGKDKPITTGIIVESNAIKRVRILVFRESRGWEVRHAFFTEQFDNAVLKQDHTLDRNIDNISGATLSVRAVTKLAQLALLLHRQVTHSTGEKS